MSLHGEVELSSVVTRSEWTTVQSLDTELVMADMATGEYYGLEASARRIWELLNTPISVESICAQLSTEYSVDRSLCEHDVIEFIGQLHRAGLVRLDS